MSIPTFYANENDKQPTFFNEFVYAEVTDFGFQIIDNIFYDDNVSKLKKFTIKTNHKVQYPIGTICLINIVFDDFLWQPLLRGYHKCEQSYGNINWINQ